MQNTQTGEAWIKARVSHFLDKSIPWEQRLIKLDRDLRQTEADIGNWRADDAGLAYAKRYLQIINETRHRLLRDI